MNKWTTFLKARMVCSVLEEDGTETHFDELGEGHFFCFFSFSTDRFLTFSLNAHLFCSEVAFSFLSQHKSL